MAARMGARLRIVGPIIGRMWRRRIWGRVPPVAMAASTKSRPEERSDFGADGAGEVGDVDEADDEGREEFVIGVDGEGAEMEALADQDDGEGDGEEIDGEGPEKVEQAGEEGVDGAAEEAGEHAGGGAEDEG